MKKKVFLAGVLIALTAAAAFAQTEADFEIRGIDGSNSIEITKYKGSATAVVIPASIDGKPVAIVSGFSNNEKIISVAIPRGATIIGEQAFMNCTNLTDVSITNTVTDIDPFAFRGCTSLDFIRIPRGVRIGNRAFWGCTKLTMVDFGPSIPSDGFHADAFYGLGDLRNKYYATDKNNGTQGSYTRANGTSLVWAKQ
jgi:hypothetical protein